MIPSHSCCKPLSVLKKPKQTASTQANSHAPFQAVVNCPKDVQLWLEISFLNLNKTNREIIYFQQSSLLDGYDS